MKFRLTQTNRSITKCSAFIIKSDSLEYWVSALDKLDLHPSMINVYPLPGLVANSVWGCLVESKAKSNIQNVEKFERLEVLENLLFIPEFSKIYPNISPEELEQLMLNRKSLFHPEIGLVELAHPIDFSVVLEAPEQKSKYIIKPEDGLTLPSKINSILINSKPVEDVLKDLEEKEFPKKEEFKDKPLNPLEKAKLKLYSALFKEARSGKDNENTGESKPTKFLDKMLNILPKSGAVDSALDKMQESFQNLAERNQKELDKFLDMIKKDPAEALKYAIPLEEYGRGEAGTSGSFQMGKIWSNFNLFGTTTYGSGGSVTDDMIYHKLRSQYHETAKELIEQGDFKKAAFVYIKLLKDYRLAAQTLEKGGYYAEAASVYLKYENNSIKAAECYEKGHLYDDAITQYKVNSNNEKVADIYAILNNWEAAKDYYDKATNVSISEGDYCKAAEIQELKLKDHSLARNTLVAAWQKNIQSQLSLSNLLDYAKDNVEKKQHIDLIFKDHIDASNYDAFIKVMKNNYSNKDELAEHIKDLSVETISLYAQSDVDVLQHLPFFNQADKQIKKDVIKYGIKNRRRKRKKHS